MKRSGQLPRNQQATGHKIEPTTVLCHRLFRGRGEVVKARFFRDADMQFL